MDNDKLNECVVKLTMIAEQHEKTIGDHESRLREVEKTDGTKWTKVRDVVISACLTVLISIIVNIIFHQFI